MEDTMRGESLRINLRHCHLYLLGRRRRLIEEGVARMLGGCIEDSNLSLR